MLDAVRGAAILLMVVDHALGFAQTTTLSEPWMHTIRMTVTRLAMPGFMVCSGILLAHHSVSRRRWTQVAVAAVVVNVAAVYDGMSTFVPDILAVWCLVMLLAVPVRRWPMTMAVLGLLQAVYWRLPFGDYQPGWVLAFVALGVLAERAGDREVLRPIAVRLPNWIVSVGRYPLRWYTGHLAVLAAVTAMGVHFAWW
ncbi:MAG: hypothetical protein JWM47_851 [Acidimicrobiales bacterium]|nr:hypothetical protein [Acidimicrobiales bacterium]